MYINATEVKNSFGKILKYLEYDDVIVKKNGKVVAKISKYSEETEHTYYVKESLPVYEPVDRKVSYEEFLKFTSKKEGRYELIDGEMYLLSSPKVTHQNIVKKLLVEMSVKLSNMMCSAFVAPFDIKLNLDGNVNVCQPDLGVICDLEDNLNEDDYYEGVPTLVIEVLSQSSVTRDKIRKLQLYMLSGIREYWIVDPMRDEALVYQFKNEEIENYEVYKRTEGISSFIFKDMHVYW